MPSFERNRQITSFEMKESTSFGGTLAHAYGVQCSPEKHAFVVQIELSNFISLENLAKCFVFFHICQSAIPSE